jgi:dTDP-4-amino-4,6-dideoxygalactose transaminase
MRDQFLNFSPPSIGEEEIAEVVDTLRSGWLTTGPKTRRFEQAFAETFAAPAAVALNSCTAGLHSALVALGIGPGDEVITTCLTFAASVNVIEHVGATPVLVDVQSDTLNLDPAQVERAITQNTKAIVPVHFAGHPVDLDAINRIAREHRLHVVEDAAHAVGAKYRDSWIGSSGNPTSFSFYATKNMTTGEGGMLTGNPELLERVRIISLHGMNHEAWNRYQKGGRWYYEVVLPGFKYNMTDVQAALGLCQLKRLTAFIRRRTEIAAKYSEAFADLGLFDLPTKRAEVTHAWHLYVLRLRDGGLSIGRDQFVAELTDRNIGTSVHFIPIHLHPYYAQKYGYRDSDFPVACESYQRMLSLPLNPAMSDQDVADVIEAVWDVAQQYRHQRRAAA